MTIDSQKSISNLSGLQRITKLVGREKVLRDIHERGEEAERKKRSALIYIEGKGGIGKTAILERIHRDIKARDDVLPVENILDIYHLENQTVRGFCDALVAQFPEHKSVFKKYQVHTRKVDESYVLTDYDKASEHWGNAEKALARAISNLTRDDYRRDRPVWILIDTAEMLYFKVSYPDDTPKMGVENLSSWLPTFLPLLRGQPVVLVLAGRPPKNEQVSLSMILSERVKNGWLIGNVIHLLPLDAPACGNYLEQVAQLLKNDKNTDGASKIQNYVKENNLKDLQRETRGEPIYLAMTCDILRTGGSLPLGFYGKKSDDKTDDSNDLTEHYMALRTPLGMTLQMMAVLRKGADSALLGELMGISKKQAEKNLRQAAHLTLVKERPGQRKRRYFLHDEVYELYALCAQQDTPTWGKTFHRIQRYYVNEFASIEASMERNPKELRHYQIQLRTAQVEYMHYALWFCPWKGFAEYFKQSIEAVGQQIHDWLNLLGVEWERTCNILRKENRYPEALNEYLNWDIQAKRVDRASTESLQIDDGVLDILKKVDKAPLLYQSYIWIIRALLALRGQPQILDDTFASCITKARSVWDSRDGFIELSLAFKVLGAYIDNYEGYLHRKRGHYKKALAAYHRAGVTMRKMKLGGLSTVLINQAYAMSMLGYDRRARETALEAYTLAKKNGSPHYQVRALNVRSLVETSAGYPENGEVHALEALDILTSYPAPRLQALVYISLARVYRYKWNHAFQNKITDIQEIGRDLLPKALTYLEGKDMVKESLKWYREKLPDVSRGAIALLADTADKENWVTGLNESGCLWREASWLVRDQKIGDDRKAVGRKKAKDRLEQAANTFNVAKNNWKESVRKQIDEVGGSYYWPILSLVNLGWYYHYLDKYPYEKLEWHKEINKICSFIDDFVDLKYLLINRLKLRDTWGGDDILLWAALGKMEMLRGYEKLRLWRKEDQALEDAVRHIYLAMEYNYQTGHRTYNNRRAEMGLETRLGRSPNWETELLPAFFKAEKVVRRKMLDEQLITKPHILNWLEERYGPAELWIDE